MHQGKRYWANLLELLARHPSATEDFFWYVIHATRNEHTLNTIATSGKCTAEMLEHLATSHHRSVRIHARHGLIHKQLDTASPEQIEEIFRQHSGDDDVSVMALLAWHPRTPQVVLDALALELSGIALEELKRRISR
jgi:hypothetical protein